MGQQVGRRILGHERNNRYDNSFCNSNQNSKLNVLNRLLKNRHGSFGSSTLNNFVDLDLLPPELGIQILQNLNATDLCLASCVWTDLANDERLWEGLCLSSWGFCSAYRTWKQQGKSFKRLFLLLDEGSLTFNTEPEWGIRYFVDNHILNDQPEDIAMFIHSTNQLCWKQVRIYLRKRQDVFFEIFKRQSFKNQFLPNALRKFFNAVDSPTTQSEYLSSLIEKFSIQFCGDNPDLGLEPDVVCILCYSLLLLSVDLASPHVKNKMSKREFIRNIRRALEMGNNAAARRPREPIDRDFAGHLYDNVYLVGHVAPQRWDDVSRRPVTHQ
uniref:F-box only protein 8 n=1 Tax=Ciona intestinalis TaxID=7719 RepID=H2XXM9_CIOIN|nr:F-box only protein 8 [Ciona intestinalis]|eukprot:XP_026696392.1 F-box only protein 8 [Ciona intestinalis]